MVQPFCEGNTRTTAVFIIKYLRSIGFDVKNTTFEKNSWYFHNALMNRFLHVRAENALVRATHTSTHTSLIPDNENCKLLIAAIGERKLSVKEIMEAVGL